VVVASVIAAVVTLALIYRWRPELYPMPLPEFEKTCDWDQKKVEWERDRVLTLAKGTAGTAASYLVALFPMIFKSGTRSTAVLIAIVGTIVGAIGTTVLAFDMVVATKTFVDNPAEESAPAAASVPPSGEGNG